MAEPVIAVTGLTKSYTADSSSKLFDDIDLTVARGELVALVGASGSGKSTLLNIVAGLEPPSAGNVHVMGSAVPSMSPNQRADFALRNIGMVHQSFHLIPFLTVTENVEIPLRLAGANRVDRSGRVEDCVNAVGLSEKGLSLVSKLSGGERQRVGIARAIANHPQVLLADEPTGNLDSKSTLVIVDLLARMCRENGSTLLLVTHDPAVANFADRVVELRDGRLLEAS